MTGTMYRVLLLTGQEIGPVDLKTLAYMAQGGQIGPFSPITDLDTRRQFAAADHPYLAARLPKPPQPTPSTSVATALPTSAIPGAQIAIPSKAIPWVIGLAVLFVIGLVSGGRGGSATELDAWQMSKQFVTKALKSPKTAEFPWFSEEFVERAGDKDFTVSAYVDSQNGFGALLRSEWTAAVHYEGSGNWRLRYLRIGDETILDTKPEPETPPQGTIDFEDKGGRSPEGDAALRRLRRTGVG